MNLIEDNGLPQVCEPCLGSVGKTRMIQDSAGAECRLCSRAFITFRWRVPKSGATKQTIICKACATKRNACQSCVMDVEFHISLSLRDTTMRILGEEGGTESDAPLVLNAIKSMVRSDLPSSINASEESTALEDIIRQFPLPGSPRPEGCRTLCVYGIEEDFDLSSLRSFFKASIAKTDCVPAGRYAFFQFDGDELPQISSESKIIDGRKLFFAWGEHISVRTGLQREVGAVLRAFLRIKAQEYISS